MIWDLSQPHQNVSNRSFCTKVIPSQPVAPLSIQVTHLVPGKVYRVKVFRTGFHANDAYSAYLEMGSPTILNAAAIRHLNAITRDLPETNKTVRASTEGLVNLKLLIRSNDIVLVPLSARSRSLKHY